MRSNDPLRRSGRPGRSNSVLVSWVRGEISRNPVSGSLALNARISSILNLISVSTAEGIEKDYSCENLKTFNTAWRSHNQSPNLHHGDPSRRACSTETRRRIGEKQSQWQNTKSKPENSREGRELRMKIDENLHEKRRFFKASNTEEQHGRPK